VWLRAPQALYHTCSEALCPAGYTWVCIIPGSIPGCVLSQAIFVPGCVSPQAILIPGCVLSRETSSIQYVCSFAHMSGCTHIAASVTEHFITRDHTGELATLYLSATQPCARNMGRHLPTKQKTDPEKTTSLSPFPNPCPNHKHFNVFVIHLTTALLALQLHGLHLLR
jgi:hypothetical protein